MKKTSTYSKLLLLLFVMLIISPNKTFAQAHDPSRGLYIDGFATVDTDDSLVPAFSILNQQSKEDSLLRYCEENHITYIILYNLSQVLDNDTTNNTYKETALCNFMHKAKTLYGITKIGAIVGSENGVRRDSIFQFRQMYPTPAFKFTSAEKTSSSYNLLKFVETAYTSSDSLFEVSELTKSALNISHFNKVAATCASPYNEKFDVINLELEFWNQLSPNQYNTTEKKILDAMARLRFLNDSIFPTSPILTEIYLGYLNKFTTPDSNAIASYLDGQLYSNGDTVKLDTSNHRLLDRFLLAYYSSDPTTSYIQNRYKYRLHTLDKSFTLPQSNTIPLFSAATIALGYDGDFFGKWFPKSNRNNIFVAEKNWYSSWLGDISHPSVPQKNITEPGQAAWFTSSIMSNEVTSSKIKHTNTFYSDSPVNTYGASSASVNFSYIGPIEQNVIIHFKLDSAGTILYSKDTVTVNSSSSIYIPSLGSKNLKPYIYTGILQMDYGNGHTYTYREPVIVYNGVQAQAMGNTTFCDGSGVILKSGKRQGSNAVMRYHWFKDSIPLYNDSTLAYYYATQAGNYYCRVDSTNAVGIAPKYTNTITVTVLTNSPIFIEQSNYTFGAARTIQARGTTLGSATFSWNTGENTRIINITDYGKYEVIATQPSGCMRSVSVNINEIQCVGNTYDYEIKSANDHATDFPGSSFNSRDSVSVHKDFHIDKNFAFHGSKIWFDPGVKIIIDSLKTLTIDSAAILQACGYMWKGIVVNPYGHLVVDDSTYIKDAENAIEATNNGTINVKKTNFRNNFNGIYLHDGNFATSIIANNSFLKTDAGKLKIPYLGEETNEHISLYKVYNSNANLQGAFIGDSVSSFSNIFKEANFAIAIRQSSAKIYNNLFYDFNSLGYTGWGNVISGTAIYVDKTDFAFPVGATDAQNQTLVGGTSIHQPNTFTNCTNGIHATNTSIKATGNQFGTTLYPITAVLGGNAPLLEINGNTILGANIGIDVADYGRDAVVNIHDNPAISVVAPYSDYEATYGIRISSGTESGGAWNVTDNINIVSLGTSGIIAEGVEAPVISGNKVFMDHTSLSSEVFGVRVAGCITPTVNCNYVRGDSRTHIANKNAFSVAMSPSSLIDNNTATNTNKGFEFLSDCDNSIIRANSMRYHQYGFVLGDYFDGLSWSSGIIGDQDTLDDSGTEKTLGNRFEGQDSAGGFGTGVSMLSINSDAAAKRFWTNSTYYPPLSFDTLRVGSYAGSLTKFLPFAPSGYPVYNVPANCVYAYKKSGGGLVECCIEPLDDPEEIIQDSRRRSSYEELVEKPGSELATEEAEFLDAMASSNAAVLSDVQIIVKEANESLNELDSITYYSKINDAISKNNEVSEPTIFEENEQQLNNLLLNKTGDKFRFTESEKLIIESIAFQCPYQGGKAVFKARPLVYSWNRNIRFDDNVLCQGDALARRAQAHTKKIKTVEKSLVKIYPNPTSNSFSIEYNLKSYNNAKILISDALGRIVYSNNLDCKTNNTKEDLSGLRPALYFVKIIADENIIAQTKITLIK